MIPDQNKARVWPLKRFAAGGQKQGLFAGTVCIAHLGEYWLGTSAFGREAHRTLGLRAYLLQI